MVLVGAGRIGRARQRPGSGRGVSRHRLGFAVKVIGGGGLPSHDTRRWQSGPHLRVSLERVRAILDRLDELDIRMYRMATQLAPYASHPDLPQFHRQVHDCAAELAALGALARERDIRLSMHPGQYTVLNSTNPAVVDAAVTELEVLGELFRALGAPPDWVIVVHIGGADGGAQAGLARFARGFAKLSEQARAHISIENDDRTFSLSDILPLSRSIGVPVVWDILHHRARDPEHIPDAEALQLAFATWPKGVTPKIHYSSPRLDIEVAKQRKGRRVFQQLVLPQIRAHADLIDPIGFEAFLRYEAQGRDFDIMLEAKGKDLALLRLRELLAARGIESSNGVLRVPDNHRGAR
jgi:UV DNA damage endonuclease